MLLLAVDHICDASRVLSKMGGKGLAECLSVSGRQPLSLNSPECNRLSAPSVESEPCLQVWEPKRAQLDPALFVLLEPVLQSSNPASSTRLMVNAKVSHDRLDWRIIWPQKFLQCPVCGSIGDNEGSFVVVDFEASFTELLAQFMPSCHDLGGLCVRVMVKPMSSTHPLRCNSGRFA